VGKDQTLKQAANDQILLRLHRFKRLRVNSLSPISLLPRVPGQQIYVMPSHMLAERTQEIQRGIQELAIALEGELKART
jgi:hypothetical protein